MTSRLAVYYIIFSGMHYSKPKKNSMTSQLGCLLLHHRSGMHNKKIEVSLVTSQCRHTVSHSHHWQAHRCRVPAVTSDLTVSHSGLFFAILYQSSLYRGMNAGEKRWTSVCVCVCVCVCSKEWVKQSVCAWQGKSTNGYPSLQTVKTQLMDDSIE